MTTYTNGLAYSTARINADFRIKIAGNLNGTRINTLVGVKGYTEIVGDFDLCTKLLRRAYDTGMNKCICKLRRGIKITFYVK